MDLTKRLKDNLSLEQLIEITNEIENEQKLINFKYQELTVLKILNILDDKCKNKEVYIYTECENDTVYFGVSVGDDTDPDEEANYLVSQEIDSVIFLTQDMLLNNFASKEVRFINNKEGRDELLKYFLLDKWSEWKKEGQALEIFENLNENMKEKTPSKFRKKL